MSTTHTDVSATYTNPRIDHSNATGDALDGEVYLDPSKVLWVGTMLIGGTVGSAMTASVGAVTLFTVFTAITLCFGHSMGMHRLFIHKSYTCPKWLEYLLVHLGTLIGLAGPLGTLKTHDIRDWAQRQTRCHDYFAHAQPWYKDALWQLVCSIKLAQPPQIRLEDAIKHNRVYALMERTWMLQQLPWAVLFYAVGGWGFVFWGICSRVTVSVIGHWLIGYFAHNEGHRSWHVDGAAVQGHNIKWTSLLTMGECWHNNHHAFPHSARLGLEPGQWDPGWWMLILLRRLGLVRAVVEPDTHNVRQDLIAIDRSPASSATDATRLFIRELVFVTVLFISFVPVLLLLILGWFVWLMMCLDVILVGEPGLDALTSTLPMMLLNLAGVSGLYALVDVIKKLPDPVEDARAPWSVLLGMVAGLIAVTPIALVGGLGWQALIGWMPILVSAHIIYQARVYLFGRWTRKTGKNALRQPRPQDTRGG